MGSPVLLTTASSRLATNKAISVRYAAISEHCKPVESDQGTSSEQTTLLFLIFYDIVLLILQARAEAQPPCAWRREHLRRIAENACAVSTHVLTMVGVCTLNFFTRVHFLQN